MTKTSKKLLLTFLLILAVILLTSVKVSAYSTEEALTALKNAKLENQTIFVGQVINVGPEDNHYMLYTLNPTVTSSNTKVVDKRNGSSYYVEGKSTGTATITITSGDVTRTYKITVIKPTDKALQSKTNDVVSLTRDYDAKRTKILLANSELWNLNKATNKLEKKVSGNVKKYVFGGVYFFEGKNTKWTQAIYTLKNNKKLTTKTDLGKFSKSNVADVSEYGYLDNKGNYYALVQKNDKVSYVKKADKVTNLLGDTLLKKKDGKLYTLDNVKVTNKKIKDAMGTPTGGLFVDSNNALYSYYYNGSTKKYEETKKATNVKKLLQYGVYLDKNGKRKTIYESSEMTTYKTISYDYQGTELKLKYDGTLYMGNKVFLKNVAELSSGTGAEGYQKHIIKKDGSVWLLTLNGKSSLKQVRNGTNNSKKLSKVTNLKVKKSGKKAKVSWKKVDGAKKYTVYRATSKNGSYKKVGTTTGASYTDKTVKKGKKYFYKVVANGSKSLYNSARTSPVNVKM